MIVFQRDFIRTFGWSGLSSDITYTSPSAPPEARRWEDSLWGLNWRPWIAPDKSTYWFQIDWRWYLLYCIVLSCIVLYCIVLYCIVLYCVVLCCIVLYCIVLYCIVLYCIVLYWIELNYIELSCTVFYLCCDVVFLLKKW